VVSDQISSINNNIVISREKRALDDVYKNYLPKTVVVLYEDVQSVRKFKKLEEKEKQRKP
jgi:ribosomal protein S17